ncbi:hypothetical protein BABINDRAFT_10690 [Babjeviella inositovora NRRL Y-12698]|uniref:FAD dependent oxidoreductase domain-containing protein n=1 Tax=Babjeviella inositovora NRRL Y-12698 TaxID=984486 RepID=A0A1E3QX02_9ASCO|nr:uncharacterized protein BABINDRAFT_10690 [Babjeviella inositovora NRRL Y-12698]ODQ82218.1 hypothetical protein BABINDRAFT_10690 [Babjeviella inositovora NRRL Y-12698]
MTLSRSIVVIGSGVTGLTTACLLAQKGHAVTVVAEHTPGDIHYKYTSPFAGANWESFAANDDLRQQAYDQASYFELLRLARHEPKAGIVVRENRVFLSAKEYDSFETPWYASVVENYRVLPQSEWPEGTVYGFSFTTVVITTSTYLQFLRHRCATHGVKFHKVKLEHISEAARFCLQPDIVVNCTGLHAATLGGVEDKAVYPIRGQVLIVANTVKSVTIVQLPEGDKYPDEPFYVMPRGDGTSIIGGCTVAHSYNPAVDTALVERVKRRAVKYVPEIVDPLYRSNPSEIKVLKTYVGFRPAREGGIRVEVQAGEQLGLGATKVIHNYGAGGAGYQSSYGTAQNVVRLVASLSIHTGAKL